jgi:hypothetical protein
MFNFSHATQTHTVALGAFSIAKCYHVIVLRIKAWGSRAALRERACAHPTPPYKESFFWGIPGGLSVIPQFTFARSILTCPTSGLARK